MMPRVLRPIKKRASGTGVLSHVLDLVCWAGMHWIPNHASCRKTRRQILQEIVDEELKEPSGNKVSGKVRKIDDDFVMQDSSGPSVG